MSQEKGLKRGPLYPSEDFRRLEGMGALVYEYLLKAHREVPFAFRDHFELWLLDGENQPLALLHSVLTETETESDVPLDWRAGIAAQENFQSSAVTSLSEPPGAYLTRYVNAHAGRPAAVQWFVRTDDGAGLVYRGTELAEAVSERPGAGAYLVERGPVSGHAVESALEVRRLV